MELSRAEYDATKAINWSRLRLIGKSPAHFAHGVGEDSSGFELGTASHACTLELEKFASDFVVYPGKVRRGKAWEAFEAEAIRAGRTVLKQSDYNEAQAIRKAIFDNPRAAKLLSGGRAEFSMVWKLGDFLCKGRGDYLSEAIVDLKTTKDASPRAFAAACAKYGYFGQGAFYSDGYKILTGQRLPYYIVAVESGAPHVVQVYRLSEASLAKGRDQYLSLLGKLDYCTRNNFWGGYSDQPEMDLEAPEYFTEGEDT